MTLAPFAEQRLTPVNYTEGNVTRPPNCMVLHIAQGSYEGTINWAKNPVAEVSYYFVVAKDGRIAQVVDLDDKAWTQGSGNRAWIGVEHEGFVPTALTAAQVDADAKILAWLNTTYGVPLQATDDPINGHGLGWHGMGASVGWGHPECPGPTIVGQRGIIIAKAKLLVGAPPAPVPHPLPPPVTIDLGDKPVKITDTTRTLDGAGRGYFDLLGVSNPDVLAFGIIGVPDPASVGWIPVKIPVVAFTIAAGTTTPRFVITGGNPGQVVTVRVTHL